MTAALKAKLAAGQPVTMVGVRYGAPALVERIGELGFDAAFIDCEKRSYTFERIEDMCRAARAAGIASVVRPWSQEPGLVSRYLDIGADGIMVASIEDVQAACALVEGVRYARHADYDSKLVIGMIESPQAVERLPQLLKVEGVDVWFIGGNDLAQRMGFPGGGRRPEVQAMVERAVGQIVGAGQVCGALVDADNVRARLDQGVRFLLVGMDMLLATGSRAFQERLPS